MGDIVNSLMNDQCDAAMVRDQYDDKALTDEKRARLKVPYTTRKPPNHGITVNKRLMDMQKKKLPAMLQQGGSSLVPITNRFAKKARKFIQSDNADDKGMRSLLEGVVGGTGGGDDSAIKEGG